MRSLGFLLSVSTINWCRSMPVESVYSTLDSVGGTSKEGCITRQHEKIAKQHCNIKHPRRTTCSSSGEDFITFYFFFFLLLDSKHTNLWTVNASLDLRSSQVLRPYRKSSRCHGSWTRCLRLEMPKTVESELRVAMVLRRRQRV